MITNLKIFKESLNHKIYTFDEVKKIQSSNKPSSDIIFDAKEGDLFILKNIDLDDISIDKDLTLDFYKNEDLDEDVHIVEKLLSLLDSDIEISPIVLDENDKIMDGLHRYVAHKEYRDYYNGPHKIKAFVKM
jgi:hypothetical protein